MSQWTIRDFTVAEGAAMSGIRRAHFDVIVDRAAASATLFSEKRGKRRWMSARDICVIRLAREIERGGRTWLDAIGMAYEHLEAPPDRTALLAFPSTPVHRSGGPKIIYKASLLNDDTTSIVPIGKIVAEIQAACAAIREADHVAIQ